jgi:sterol desaturase/sphingolipid hydroxylase (fatty acid hydroxylase superfamily)
MPFLFNPLLRLFDSFGSPLLAVVFLALLWLQKKYPLRRQHLQTLRRIATNLVFAVPSFLTLRLLLIPIPLAAAAWATHHDVGLLNWLPLPPLIAGVLGILLLDYIYYWWHVATHLVPFLWRFHNVHHTDLDLDVSTATRFHVVELIFSVIWRAVIVAILGIAPLTLLVFELAFEAAAQFHHSNWRLHPSIERALNRVLVTPRMHGIHHSIVLRETNSNWGTIFSWWDALHRTLRLNVSQDAITIGVPAWRDAKELTVADLFQMPFRQQRSWKLPNGEQPERR